MNWKDILNGELERAYKATAGLIDMVDDTALGWKPATGSNWMTTGQLLHHLAEGCGKPFAAFVTGDWGRPAGADPNQKPPRPTMPGAEQMPAMASVAEAKKRLEEDRKLTQQMLASCSEADLASRPAPAPWDPSPLPLGPRLLQMVDHLKQHKGQLYYYLKLQGKPVNTGNLWGM